MLHTSEAFREAIKSPQREIYFRLRINGIWYEKDKLYSADVSYGSSNEEFAIGTAYANSLRVVFSEVITDFSELDEVYAEVGIKLPDGIIEYVPLGYFVISEQVDVNRNDNNTTINCLDNMILMEGEYSSDLSYPARIIDVAVEIANKAGIEVNETSFAKLSTNRINKIEGATYRQAIAMIAQFEGGFAIFNRDGKLDIRTLNNTDFEINPSEYRSKGMTKNDLQYRLGGISVEVDDETTLHAGSKSGSQINLTNSAMTQSLLNNIYASLENINFYPFTLEWWGNPALEYGDWVTLVDVEGNGFKAPVLKYTLNFAGGLSSTISANVDVTSSNMVSYRAPLQQEVQAIKARLAASGGNYVYDGLGEPINPEEGDIWFKPNGPDTLILVYKRLADGTLDWSEKLNTGDVDKVAREVARQQEEIDKAKRQALASKQEAIDEAERLVTEQDAVYQDLFDGYDAAVDDLTQGVANADAKAVDALTQAGESQSLAQSNSQALQRVEGDLSGISTKAEDALGQAINALSKANEIPATIDGVIADRGLVAGDWVNKRINEETGEIRYGLESVRGDIPDVIVGVEWDKSSDPQMTRTDYVESYVNLDDYRLQSAEFRVSVEGLGMDLAEVKRDKLDSGVFTTFKTNEYANDIDGIRQRLTNAEENKLDNSTFQSFKEHDYQVTVNGLNGSIQRLKREKVGESEFESFKSNEYQLTVDGFEMALTSVEGAVPNLVLGVEWNRTESPRMERTDYLEEIDLTNYDAPDYVMGVEWDKKENPEMIRTYDTQESTSKEEFELFLSEYSFRADGWDAANAYVTENSTALNSLMNNAFGWSQTISYVDENRQAFNETVSQVDFYKQTIGSSAENIAQLVMTDDAFVTRIGQLEGMAEDVIVGVEWDKSSDPNMTRTGYMDDWTETQVKQLADSWIMEIKSGRDIKTAINATTDGLHLLGKNIQLDGDTHVTGNFAVSGDHVILDADTQIRGDFTVRGSNVVLDANTTVLGEFKVLGGNVILDGNTTVHGDFSVFGKNIILDGDTTVTGDFTVSGEIVGPGIRADNITTGTLDAGQLTVVNLDVHSLSGNIGEFVRINLNDSMGGNVSATGAGIVSTAADSSQVYIQNGVVGARNPQGAGLGHIGYINRGDSPHFAITTSVGAHFSIFTNPTSGSNFHAVQVINNTETYIRTNDFRHTGSAAYLPTLTMSGQINMDNYNISRARMISFRTGAVIEGQEDNSNLRLATPNNLILQARNDTALFFDGTHGYMYRTLSMEGNNITNQSDERLKRDISATEYNSLEIIKQLHVVGFNYKDDELNARVGRQIGVLAQEAPHLALYDEKTDTWSINSSKQIMHNSHAIQQLAFKTESELDKVKKELKEANQRIEELEGKVA